jgi:hypothetical protein
MKKTLTLFSLLAVLLVSNACNKKGCSDPTADNYVSNVKKARDKKCQYDGEGICGVGVTFCFEINGTKRKGQAQFLEGAPGSNMKKIFWKNSTFGSPNYEDVIIWIYGNKEASSYSLSNTGNDKTFYAEYYTAQNGIVQAANSGSLSIKKDNTSDGIIATFSFTTQSGTKVEDGNIYKLQ